MLCPAHIVEVAEVHIVFFDFLDEESGRAAFKPKIRELLAIQCFHQTERIVYVNGIFAEMIAFIPFFEFFVTFVFGNAIGFCHLLYVIVKMLVDFLLCDSAER